MCGYSSNPLLLGFDMKMCLTPHRECVYLGSPSFAAGTSTQGGPSFIFSIDAAGKPEYGVMCRPPEGVASLKDTTLAAEKTSTMTDGRSVQVIL